MSSRVEDLRFEGRNTELGFAGFGWCAWWGPLRESWRGSRCFDLAALKDVRLSHEIHVALAIKCTFRPPPRMGVFRMVSAGLRLWELPFFKKRRSFWGKFALTGLYTRISSYGFSSFSGLDAQPEHMQIGFYGLQFQTQEGRVVKNPDRMWRSSR